MKIHFCYSIAIVVVMAALVSLSPAASGQSASPKTSSLPRLPNGKPDFNGV
jgi:hypothetical protein